MANTKSRKGRNYKRSKKHDTAKEVEASKLTSKANDALNKNDPEWYFRDPILKHGLASLPTFEFRGMDTVVGKTGIYFDSSMPTIPEYFLASPTVAVHSINPSPGYATDANSAINMAARMLYSKLSSSNAKTSNYAPQDVATLMLGIGEVISMISHLTRAYGITQFYNKMNRAIPEALLKANGITVANLASWTQNLPQFRAELNQLITVANSISFPSNIAYFKKCAYVYQNIYIDNYSSMTGYHMMVPYSTWHVDETSYAGGTILKTSVLDGQNPTYIMSALRSQINEILTSATYNYIYSDIINLATRGVLGSDLLSFGTIPIDYVVEPILSDQFNWQLMNATIYGSPNGTLNTSGNDILETPDNDVYPSVNHNTLVYKPYWRSNGANWFTLENILEPIVRTPDVGISDDDLIELTAYTGNKIVDIAKKSAKVDSVDVVAYLNDSQASIPDHYVVKSAIYYGQTSDSRMASTTSRNCVNVTSANTGAIGSLTASLATEFEHFPLVYGWRTFTTDSGTSVNVPDNLRFFARLGSYTLGMVKAICNIRKASYLGLFTME